MQKRRDKKIKLARRLQNDTERKKKGWGPFNCFEWQKRADKRARKEALRREQGHARREAKRLKRAKAHSALLREHKLKKA